MALEHILIILLFIALGDSRLRIHRYKKWNLHWHKVASEFEQELDSVCSAIDDAKKTN